MFGKKKKFEEDSETMTYLEPEPEESQKSLLDEWEEDQEAQAEKERKKGLFGKGRKIREMTETPVFFITARVMEEDELNGYAVGADDYITKPFSLPVLYAKVMAMTGRLRGGAESEMLVRGDVAVNVRTHSVRIGGETCQLAPKEYELLVLFLENPNRIFTRDQLLIRLWGYDFEGNERVVDNHIKKLRKALALSRCRIHTVRKSGYGMEVSI